MKRENTPLDELESRITYELQKNGRLTSSQIAAKLGISDSTVRYRLNRLIKSNVVKVSASVNPFAFRTGLLAIIGMELEKRTYESTMKELSELEGVESVCTVTGRYDLLLEVFLGSREELNDFVVKKLSAIRGINRTETFIVLDAIGKWIKVAKPLP